MALENGRANERRIAARGESRGKELWKWHCRSKPMQHLRHRRGCAGHRAHARFEAATHRVLPFRATGVLRRIRVRNGSCLAIRRHQWGDSRKGDRRTLQADGEHHDDREKLTLHNQKLNRRGTLKQIIGMSVC